MATNSFIVAPLSWFMLGISCADPMGATLRRIKACRKGPCTVQSGTVDTCLTATKAALAEIIDTELAALIDVTYKAAQTALGLLSGPKRRRRMAA